MVVAGERVRLNEEDGAFDERRYLGIVSFRQKYFPRPNTPEEFGNAVDLFSRYFGKGSNFSEANPKPPCGKGQELLIPLLRNRLEGLRREVRIMYLTGNDSIFMREKLDHFDRLKGLIDTVEQQIRLGTTECAGEPPAGQVQLEATDLQQDELRRILKKFAVLFLQSRHAVSEYATNIPNPTEVMNNLTGVNLTDEQLSAFAKKWEETTQENLPVEIKRILLDTDLQQLDKGAQEELVAINKSLWENIKALVRPKRQKGGQQGEENNEGNNEGNNQGNNEGNNEENNEGNNGENEGDPEIEQEGGQATEDAILQSWETTENELANKEDPREQIVGTIQWLMTTITKQQAAVSAKQGEMDDLNKKLQEAEAAAQTSSGRISAIQNELVTEKEKAANLVQQLGDKDALITAAQSQTAAAVQEKQAALASAEQILQIEKTESDKLRAQIEARAKDLGAAQRIARAAVSELAVLKKAFETMKLSGTAKEKEFLNQTQKNMTAIAEAEGRAAGAEASLKELQEMNKTIEESTTAQINELTQQLQRQTRGVEQMGATIIELTQERDALKGRVAALTSEESARLRDVQGKLEQAIQERDKIQADLERAKLSLNVLQESARARGIDADAALQQRSVENLSTSLKLGMARKSGEDLRNAIKEVAEAVATGKPYKIPTGLGGDESSALRQLLDNVEKLRETQGIGPEPVSPSMELCFLSYFVSYFNKLVFYGVAKTQKELLDMQELQRKMDAFVEGSAGELNRLRGVGGRSAALKILLDVTFDCLQAGEDYMLTTPDFSKAGYYFVKNDGPGGSDNEWSYRNNRYNDAFYAIYKQFDDAFTTNFPETLRAMSGVVFSRLSPKLADIFFRPRFKTAGDAVPESPAPGKYPSFIYAPAGAPLSPDVYYIFDMDKGGVAEKRGDLNDQWRQTIGSKISGQKLPYAGLFFYFLALAREYLKDRGAELGRLGCPLPRVLREGGEAQGPPAAASPGAPGAPESSGISTNIVAIFKIIGQIERGTGESMQAELNSNISTHTNKNTAPPTASGPVRQFINKYKEYTTYFTPLSVSLANFKSITDAQKRATMHRYFGSLYTTMKKNKNGERVFYMFLLDLFRAYVRQYKIKGATTLDQKIDRLFAEYNNYILSAPFAATRKTMGQHLEITRDVLKKYAKGPDGDYPTPKNPFTQFNQNE